MNQIEVKLVQDELESSSENLCIAFKLTIDGASPLFDDDDDFDIYQFIESTRTAGRYFIMTCSCGDPGCAGYGYGIQVTIEGDITYWTDRDQNKTYSFSTGDLQSKALMLENEINKWSNEAIARGAKLAIAPFLPRTG